MSFVVYGRWQLRVIVDIFLRRFIIMFDNIAIYTTHSAWPFIHAHHAPRAFSFCARVSRHRFGASPITTPPHGFHTTITISAKRPLTSP